MARSRSKSPSKAAAGFDPMDYKDEVIALLMVGGLAHVAGLDAADPASITSLLSGGGGSLPVIGQGTLLTLHTLNVCQGRGSKFWLQDLCECMVAVFASGIALALLGGGSLADAIMLGSEGQWTFVALCWYLQNHSIAGVVPNVWDLVTSSPIGAPLQKVLDLGSLCFINNLIMAASAGVDADELNVTKISITPLVKGVLVGSASTAIVSTSDVTAATAGRSLVLSVITSTNGLATVPVAGPIVAGLLEKIPAPIGGSTATLYTNCVAITYFFGDLLASVGVPSEVLNPVPVVTGLVNKVLML